MIEFCPLEIKQQVLEYLTQRFGLPASLFDSFEFYAGPTGRVILGPKLIDTKIEADTAGLLIARIGKSVKPSTNLLQLFGGSIGKNVIQLDREKAIKYVRGLDLHLDGDKIGEATGGYVVLKYDRYSLGCGLLQGNQLKNMLPKAKRLELKYL